MLLRQRILPEPNHCIGADRDPPRLPVDYLLHPHPLDHSLVLEAILHPRHLHSGLVRTLSHHYSRVSAVSTRDCHRKSPLHHASCEWPVGGGSQGRPYGAGDRKRPGDVVLGVRRAELELSLHPIDQHVGEGREHHLRLLQQPTPQQQCTCPLLVTAHPPHHLVQRRHVARALRVQVDGHHRRLHRLARTVREAQWPCPATRQWLRPELRTDSLLQQLFW